MVTDRRCRLLTVEPVVGCGEMSVNHGVVVMRVRFVNMLRGEHGRDNQAARHNGPRADSEDTKHAEIMAVIGKAVKCHHSPFALPVDARRSLCSPALVETAAADVEQGRTAWMVDGLRHITATGVAD